MNKREKRTTFGIILIIFAVIQIINFARLNINIYPQFYLSVGSRGLLRTLTADFNWPFKVINFYTVKLLGWTGLVIPLFLISLGITFFEYRQTKKVKRKQKLILLTIAQLVFSIYYINYISFVILPNQVKPGLIAELFAQYLRKVGGISFISIVYFYTLISYILVVKKSDWNSFWKSVKKSIKLFFKIFVKIIHSFQDSKRKEKKKITNTKTIDFKKNQKQNKNRSEKYTEKGNNSYKSNNKENSYQNSNSYNEINTKDEKDYIDATFEEIKIKEFDTTKLKINFDYNTLNPNIINNINEEKQSKYLEKITENYKKNGYKLEYIGKTKGPRSIRLEFRIPDNIKSKEIESIFNELSFRLGGVPLNLQLPIPHTANFGISYPRDTPDMLGFGSYLNHLDEQDGEVPTFIGVDTYGNGLWTDAAKFPHLLIAGSTGSGKSVFLNSLIINFIALSKKVPINLLMVDPKRVEFSPYKNIKQLSYPIITEMDEATSLIETAVELMEKRYKQITKIGVRNIKEFNEMSQTKMPYLFIIIDEFSDLVMQDKSGIIKDSIIRLGQKSRAVGIHVILATQRPSSDVIDGLIKANFPARVAFKTSSKVDSRIILDKNGAEELLGKGDMLIKINSEERLQGVFVDIKEIKKITDSL